MGLGGCRTCSVLITQVGSSECKKCNLLKGTVGKLAQPFPQGDKVPLLSWKADTSAFCSGGKQCLHLPRLFAF